MLRNSLTLLEIEQRTGIKKSSMQRYVSGETGKIPLAAIEKLAKLFGVSAAYLMGWDEKKESPSEPQLTGVDQELWDLLKRMPEDQKRLMLAMGRSFENNLNKD
jgi:transcriptional regulator with XRE-family HTH domain